MKLILIFTIIFSCYALHGQKLLNGIDTLDYEIISDSIYKPKLNGDSPQKNVIVNFHREKIEFSLIMTSQPDRLDEINYALIDCKKSQEIFRVGWYKKNNITFIGFIRYLTKEEFVLKDFNFFEDGSLNAFSDSTNNIIYKKGEVYPDFDLSNLNKIPDFFKYYQVTNCKHGFGLEPNWDCLPIEELRENK